jgi:hypothetical protein
MLSREIIAVCSEIHTKHINTLCPFYGIPEHRSFTSRESLYPPAHVVTAAVLSIAIKETYCTVEYLWEGGSYKYSEVRTWCARIWIDWCSLFWN